MDYESEDSRAKGCWDPATMLSPFLEKWSSPAATATTTPDFVVDEVWCGMVGSVGFGEHGTPEKVAFWTKTLQEVYRGDEGRKKAKMALLNLLTRDGLLQRLRDITCPVHWLQVRPRVLTLFSLTRLTRKSTISAHWWRARKKSVD